MALRRAGAAMASAILGLAATQASAVPPAPPPPAVVAIAQALPDRFNAGDVQGYATLFADDVAVYDHDHLIFKGRAAWTAYVARQAADEVSYRVVASALAPDEILTFEAWSNFPRHARPPNVIQDCCTWSRLAAYKVEAGKITEARFLDNMSAEPPR